jgi:hypothetical protein
MQELEQECDRYKTVIHKLSNKVEAANAAGTPSVLALLLQK